MSWEDIAKIISTFIVSVGGSGAIILKLSSYFGNRWAEKHLEKIKKDYQKEIDHYKSQLDILKESSLRYSSQQFQIYNLFWLSLYDLKIKADSLWEEANNSNLTRFVKQLKNTIDQIEKSSLFIEDSHYHTLKEVLHEFSQYEIGKTKLIRYKVTNHTQVYEIENMVENNRRIKQRYEELIESIKSELKNQLRGNLT